MMTEKKLRNNLRLAVVNLMMYEGYTEGRICRLTKVYFREGLMKPEVDERFIQILLEGKVKNDD